MSNQSTTPFSLAEAIDILSRTPRTLEVLLHNLPDTWIAHNEGGESWSPFDIIGHLIHGEKTDWMVRTRIILREGSENPFDPFDRFAQFESSKGKELSQLLSEFEHLRTDNIADLRALELTNEQLLLTGQHPEFGEVTMRELLSTWVVHDLSHIAQICRVMGKHYINEVGPWKQYIPLLTR